MGAVPRGRPRRHDARAPHHLPLRPRRRAGDPFPLPPLALMPYGHSHACPRAAGVVARRPDARPHRRGAVLRWAGAGRGKSNSSSSRWRCTVPPLHLQPLEGNQSLAYFPFVPYDTVLTTGSAVVGFDFGFPTVSQLCARTRSVACLSSPARASLSVTVHRCRSRTSPRTTALTRTSAPAGRPRRRSRCSSSLTRVNCGPRYGSDRTPLPFKLLSSFCTCARQVTSSTSAGAQAATPTRPSASSSSSVE